MTQQDRQAEKRRSSKEILADIIRNHYGFAEVGLPEFMPMAHQRRHQKYVCETSRGKFMVKTYKRDPYVLDALRFQHRLSDHLLEHGLPVAHIQRAQNGKRIVEIDDWALELQEFVEGESMKVNSETLHVSGDALGTFHEVCRDFPRPGRDSRMWRFSEVPRETFRVLYDKALAHGDRDRVTDDCNRIALFLHDAAKALDWDARGHFETGLIHGDWHSGNLLFKGNRLVAILDLEFAGDGCYLEDLAYAVSNLCIRTTMNSERLKKRTNILLDKYQVHRSLSFAEEAALYYAVGVKHVATVSFQCRNTELVAGYPADSWMERLAFQCEWLAKRAHAVRFGE